jgi:5-hydroxyisourate hydrolase-like protein (transthyretin family)
MRFLLLLTAAVSFAQPAPEKSALTGRVVSAATGAPLKKTTVWLEKFAAERNVNAAPSVPEVITDSEGRFTIPAVEAGAYFLQARRTGYLDQGYGASVPDTVGPPLEIAVGETKRDLILKLTPQSLVYGKIVDEDNDPAPGAQVAVLRVSYAGGHRHLVDAGLSESQDDGSFVVGNLKPGRYYISAFLPNMSQPPTSERHIKTFYPSAADANDAQPVEVAAGAEVRGVAIRLRKSRVFRVRGRAVIAADSTPAGGVSLILHPTGRGGKTLNDGRFEIEAVPPGSYWLETAPQQALAARIPITVAENDVDGVVFPIGNGANLDCKVRGADTGSIALTPVGRNLDSRLELQIGAARFYNLLPVVYSIDVNGLPAGSYVKGITFQGRPVVDWTVDLSSGAGGDLVVDVSPDAGEVSGKVDKPGVVVQIWPSDGDTARSTRSGPHGEFRFDSLPPGDYRVIAWQDLDDDLAQYAPFRAAFTADASTVHVGERAHERVEPRTIALDAIAAEAAKLK